jgi:hypothetical protein
MGRSLHLLFGIRGRRRDEMTCFLKIFNEGRVRLSAAETPRSALPLDAGCYRRVMSLFVLLHRKGMALICIATSIFWHG